MTIAQTLFNAGFTQLVTVAPPGAKLSVKSKLKPATLGKAPARRGFDGWYGYDWRRYDFTIDEAKRADTWEGNLGMQAKHWPAVDIDCTDEAIATIIADVAQKTLGSAPERIGQAPKRLLMYRTAAPFGRMRMRIEHNGQWHLLEVLGEGQQYVVAGTHPKTGKPYTWSSPLAEIKPEHLAEIDRKQVAAFFDEVERQLDVLGCTFERAGDGTPPVEKAPVEDQYSLRAPSLKALREAVSYIPNNAPTYEDYITFGIAVKAAGTEDLTEALQIFHEWAARWEDGYNEPADVERDWNSMRAPFRIGWDFIASEARRHGYLDAAEEFEALPAEVIEAQAAVRASSTPIEFSDSAIAARFVTQHLHEIRYCDAMGGWLIWDGTRWAKDELMRVHHWAGIVACEAANEVKARADWKAAKVDRIAYRLASHAGRSSIVNYAATDPRVMVSLDQFDADPWLLNTPAGVVDLKTGRLRERTPGELFMKCTAVSPDFTSRPAKWLQFMTEAMAGDAQYQDYWHVQAGYYLTGLTSEQILAFLHGAGGNGKSVFVNTIAWTMGDYAKKASIETFTASHNDRHPTELAALRGARLVYASETQGGKRWHAARIKELTGSEPITARFMHRDEFTFIPNLKLLLMGNHRPELREIDEGIKRRLHLCPFEVTPKVIDRQLEEKLRDEAEQILAWMIEGCVRWQLEGIKAPAKVIDATDDYIEDEDAIGRWIAERCVLETNGAALSSNLYEDWRAWCQETGEFAGTQKRLSVELKQRGFKKWREPHTGRQGFKGIELVYNPDDFGVARKPAQQEEEI